MTSIPFATAGVPYRHPTGAVQFVDLGRPGILRPPAGVLKRPAAESVEEPAKKVAREEVVRRFVTES